MGNKIMVVDDDKEFLEELDTMLELAGYSLVAVEDAEKAIEVAQASMPRMVILDLKMPKKNGFQIANELRQLPIFSTTPIIAMSGCYRAEFDPILKICGITRCLKKPFQPLDVIAEIEKLVGVGC